MPRVAKTEIVEIAKLIEDLESVFTKFFIQ